MIIYLPDQNTCLNSLVDLRPLANIINYGRFYIIMGLNCYVNKFYELRNNLQMNIFYMLKNDITFTNIIIDNIGS
jgi:hypothetical protein